MIFELTNVLRCCQKFKDSSNNKGIALMLNPLIRVCVSQRFTDLCCSNRLSTPTFTDSGFSLGQNGRALRSVVLGPPLLFPTSALWFSCLNN